MIAAANLEAGMVQDPVHLSKQTWIMYFVVVPIFCDAQVGFAFVRYHSLLCEPKSQSTSYGTQNLNVMT